MNKDMATLPKKGLKTKPYSMDMNKDVATLTKKDLKTRPYNMDMENHIVNLPKKGLKTKPYDMDMENHIVNLPKKGLKTKPYSMDMNKDIATLPKKGLKARPYNIGMEKRDLKKYDYTMYMEKEDLKKLSKGQLIRLLLKQEKKKSKVVIVNDTKPTRPNRPPPPIPEKKVVDDRPGWAKSPKTNRWLKIDGPTYRKLYPMQHVLSKIDKMNQEINETSKSIDDKYKSIISPIPQYDFDDDIFQTENTSLGKFKIISVQNRENKKFKSYTNEFKVKILKKLDDDKDIYHIFQEIVKTVKKRRNLSNNDMLRIVIQNEELPDAISTKFNKVQNFELGDLDDVIRILEYRGISIEKCNIVVQSVGVPAGKGRLHLTKDTVSRKNCIITVKNDDTTCLARSIVTAMANLHPEEWTKTQLKNGFNSSRKLQRDQAMKLHEEANVEINDYGNDLTDVETFAKHLGIEINIIDAEQFNSIIYTANKGSEDKIYLLKTRNHFDVIKSLTAFYDTPYYCHECKKAYTKRDKHKCPSKCLSCFTYTKDTKCEGK